MSERRKEYGEMTREELYRTDLSLLERRRWLARLEAIDQFEYHLLTGKRAIARAIVDCILRAAQL